MNITGRDIYVKPPKVNKDPAYLARVRELPCCICHEYGLPQLSATTAHHPICERGGNRKVPDTEAIPLCDGHHQGDRDKSKLSIHRDRYEWVEAYGSDRRWIGWTQKRLGKDEA